MIPIFEEFTYTLSGVETTQELLKHIKDNFVIIICHYNDPENLLTWPSTAMGVETWLSPDFSFLAS